MTELSKSTEDDEEVSTLEDALDHLAFVDGSLDLEMLDVEQADEEEDLGGEVETESEEEGAPEVEEDEAD